MSCFADQLTSFYMMRVLTERYFQTNFNLLLSEKDWMVFLRYHSFVAVIELVYWYMKKTVLYYLRYDIICSYILAYFFYLHNLLPLTCSLILTLPSTG